MIGRKLGRYQILDELGSGGMGEVYLAEDPVLQRRVAVKLLSEALESDAWAVRRFLREARSAAAIEHPFICQIFEIGEAEGRSFIAMEHVSGHTLKDELAGGTMSLDRALRLASEIAEALEEAHRAGIVHRDLKPANIMLTPGDHIKVMDFGLAKRLTSDEGEKSGETRTKLTEDGSTLGTVAYMSPEQLRAEDVDLRSDIFSFGLVLYEMVTGTHPFARPTQVEISSAILGENPPPLARFVSDPPEVLSHTVRKMLAKDPEDRYQSVHEVRTDLADLLKGDSSGSSGTLAPEPSTPPRRWGTAVALVVALVAVGAVAWLLGRGGSTEPEAGEITSLAVLPLDNLMGDPEQQYFVDGMHDALITELSKIGALRVISRTSVLRLKGDQDSLEEIADALEVDALVEGSIMRSENSVRITAQLVGVRPERHLWAENFERELGNVLALQSDVARAIAAEIRVTLTPEEEDRLAMHRPVPQAAHDSYLRGLYFADQRGEEGMHKAQAALTEAVATAPDWAPPYAALAELHFWLAFTGHEAPNEALPKAKAYALEALELDDTLSSAHLTLAQISLAMDWDWTGAEEQVVKTLELNPNSSSAYEFHANILLVTGRTEEAIDDMQRAVALEPLAHRYSCNLGYHYYAGRRYDESLRSSIDTLEMWGPVCPAEDHFIVSSYIAKGMYEKAIARAEKAVEQFDRNPRLLAALAEAYGAAGRTSDARTILAELEAVREERFVDPTLFALVYLALGDYDAAFAMLERAYDVRSAWLPSMSVDPRADPIRDDPRFKDLLRRIGLESDRATQPHEAA